MAYPQGSLITKANMISDFNSLVITARNNAIIWASGEAAWDTSGASKESGGGTTGDPFDPHNSLGTYSSGDANPLGGRTASSLADSTLTNPISATNVYNSFRDTAIDASNIRLVKLIKYMYTTDTRTGADSNVNSWEYWRVASMNPVYESSIATSSNPAGGANVDASDLDAFVSSIVTAINTLKGTAVSFSEYYCHSSCHSSCHNSRSRR
jgi:hypothetical protein